MCIKPSRERWKVQLAPMLVFMSLLSAGCELAGTALEPSVGQAGSVAVAPELIPGRFIVTLRPGTRPELVAAEHGLRPDFVYRSVIVGFAGPVAEMARAQLLRDARVLRVEPDGVVRMAETQTGATWGLDRIDQRSLPLSGDFTYEATGAGVTAYVIDTGIRLDHQEFSGRASAGYDALGEDGSDCNGHGTHVAGTLAGTIYGVAKEARLVAVRVLDCNGSGTWSGVIAGIDWVAANRTLPAVANLSLSGGANATADDALRGLIASGVATSVAAGNQAGDACTLSPARVAEAMTVGATDAADARASFSNYGDCLDWFAPGVQITSAWHTDPTATRAMDGTSMAAPHTAGVAALFLGVNPSTSSQAVRDTLYAAATKSIVTLAASTNSHLLFSGVVASEPPPAPPPPPPANTAPVASFVSSCTELVCQFTDQSTDADGSIASWSWRFGDGAASIAQHPTHTYAVSGVYAVELTVTDNAGATATASASVRVVKISLAASGYKVKGSNRVDLTWSGALASSVDVWRNGSKLTTTENDGAYTDVLGKGGGTYQYRVCEAGTTTCSNEVKVVF